MVSSRGMKKRETRECAIMSKIFTAGLIAAVLVPSFAFHAYAAGLPSVDKASINAAAKRVKWKSTEQIAKGVKSAIGGFKPDGAPELRISAVRISAKSPWLAFTGTGRSSNWGKPMAEAKTLYNSKGVKIDGGLARVRRERTVDFMKRNGPDMVVAFASSSLRPPWSGDYASPRGLVISDGTVVADRSSHAPLLVVWKDGTVSIRTERLDKSDYAKVQLAHTGYDLIRRDGEDIVAPARNTRAPRLAAGVSREGSVLWIVEVDDAVNLAYGSGATYHDMNAVFAALGCDDAMCLAYGNEAGIYVKDPRTGSVEILNKMAKGTEPTRVTTSIGVRVTKGRRYIAASPSAGDREKKGPEQITGRFSRTRLSVVRNKSLQTLGGKVSVSVSSDLPRFKRPVLYVAALYDVDGMWRMYDVVCTSQDTCGGHLMSKGQTPARISRWQPEVSKKAWSPAEFGDTRPGFFADCSIGSTRAELIGYRLEVWQNGGLVDSHDSNESAFRRAGAPEDWYVKGKYPGKIVYRWPPPKE